MSVILAMSPGLLWFGCALMALGSLGLIFGPVAQREVRRVALSGVVAFLVGALPQVAVSGMPGQAWAHEAGAAQDAIQQAMLSGMGSQIVYDAE